jgi:hypothetical protein
MFPSMRAAALTEQVSLLEIKHQTLDTILWGLAWSLHCHLTFLHIAVSAGAVRLGMSHSDFHPLMIMPLRSR